MLEEAINYPRESDDLVRTLVIGSILTIISFLFIPIFFLLGYYQRILAASMDGEELPVFDEWGDMFVDGLKAFVVVFLYFLIPAIVFGISIGTAIGGASFGDINAISGALLAGALVGTLVSVVLGLAFWYAAPAGLANLARTGRIGSAFSWSEMKDVLFDSEYAVAWALALAVLIATGIVAGVFNLVPFGFLLAIPINFYGAMVAFNLYGRGVEASTDMESGPEAPKGRPAA
ncbi:DUF4013 domain-containing protein [Halorarius litoreus]|uniref:DUF4013 domain-containing protein n=1 Tax=Halorarius litoreus TaxID=2962676 RepID=UPI0020CEDF44|nr:DUF4013 domain-containing protein [Halorarius litoreus]